jgi:arginine/lysine/ornithine decarboxylase
MTSSPDHDQSDAPLADAIENYWRTNRLSFSIPAHGGGRGPLPEFVQWAGEGTARADLPMTHGVDTRDRRWRVQERAEELFAQAVGARSTLFSTNGSSLSARVAMMTVVGPGETLIMARNGHKSAFAGLILTGARPVYLEPSYDDELEVALDPSADDLAEVLAAHPEARAAMVFTPSYYGTSADVRALADVVHGHDIPLVTDDAWGLDYGLCGHPDLPEGALVQGSDLAIGSVHKTLTGLSQTSVLSVGSERIDTERLSLCFELEKSTSSSSLLVSSIDGARRQFVRDGRALLDRAVEAARLLRERLRTEVPELEVVATQSLERRAGVAAADPTHVLIETAPVGLTGYQADDWLRDERQIDVELADHRRIMPLVTFAHGPEEIDRLVRGLRDLVDSAGSPGAPLDEHEWPSRSELRTTQEMLPRDAFFARSEMVPSDAAVGRVTAEYITPYPPGIPVLAPGELINQAAHDYLQRLMAVGGFVEGAADPQLEKMRVVAE